MWGFIVRFLKADLATRIEIAQHGRVARLNRLVNRIELLVRLLRLHLIGINYCTYFSDLILVNSNGQ